MHAFCHKGKQKTLRAGFYYAIPSTFLNGWTSVAQLVFRDVIENRQDLTTHGAGCPAHEFEPAELLALGDWQDKAPVRASMPLHYSNTRYQLSAKINKLLVAPTWEEVTPMWSN